MWRGEARHTGDGPGAFGVLFRSGFRFLRHKVMERFHYILKGQ